jgi:DUF971 family protein
MKRTMGLLDRIQFRKGNTEPPESLDVTESGDLRVVWPGGVEAKIPAFALRDACPCAECVEEGTGRKILDPSTIPADVRFSELRPVGNYAVQIFWSDGHSTGIYSWQTLREACLGR